MFIEIHPLKLKW